MQQASGSSLSFLDLLTCALGGILLLFFVVITLREQDASIGSQSGRSSGATSDEVVFVHIYSSDRSSIFDGDGPHLELKPGGNPIASRSPIASIDEGDSFATFFAVSRVPRNSELVLRGLKKDVPVRFFVADRFGAGDKVLPSGESKVLYQFGVAR